jgi:O-antigen/teichoic acid export membrane protein
MGMETAFFRFFSAENQSPKVISTSFLLMCITSVLFLGIAWPAAGALATYLGFPEPLFIKLLALTLFFDTLVVIPFAWLRAKGKSLIFASYKIINVLITLALNVWLLLILPESGVDIGMLPELVNNTAEVSDIFAANLAASILTFLMCLPILRNLTFSLDKGLLARMLRYGIPIMIAGIAYAINENLDKLFIARYLGDHVNGMYAACYKLGVFMSLYVMTFRLGAEPFFFNQYGKDGAENLYSRILTWFVVLAGLCLLVVTGFVDFFAGLLLKRDSYKEALDIVPVILVANIFLGIYNNLSIWYKLKDKTGVGMLISVIGALLTIVLLISLIPVIGYLGAAYTTLIVYFFMAAASYLLGKKYYPIPYEVPKVLFYLTLSAGLAFISFYWLRGDILYNILVIFIFSATVFYLERGKLVAGKPTGSL